MRKSLLFVALVLLLAGCGPTPAPTAAPAATVVPPTRTAVPPTATVVPPTRTPTDTPAPTPTAPSTPTSTPPPTATPVPACTAVGQTWRRPADGMEMVCVPAGEFTMGSAYGDADAKDDEKPRHTVYLDAYWIDRTEVTVAQFRAFV
ncbi:MAG: formylglycine-generating enzyme family protein, partial [Candidatus Bathyarchaeia archaeon]